MKTKNEMQIKWIDLVFDDLFNLEYNVLHLLDTQTIDTQKLEKARKDLQMHYGALENLKKSFNNDTFFVGFCE